MRKIAKTIFVVVVLSLSVHLWLVNYGENSIVNRTKSNPSGHSTWRGTYYGELKEGVRKAIGGDEEEYYKYIVAHGFGKLVRGDVYKRVYVGEWMDGFADGEGKFEIGHLLCAGRALGDGFKFCC